MGRIKLNRNDYLNNSCACFKCNTVISQIDEITLCKCRSTYIRTVCWSLKQYCPTYLTQRYHQMESLVLS